ncbi:hypothetical protein [Methylorubrum populi]
MADTASPTTPDFEEQVARIRRMNVETQKFVEEGLKLAAEARKLNRDATIAPYTALFTAFTAGAAVVGAVAALLKLYGP